MQTEESMVYNTRVMNLPAEIDFQKLCKELRDKGKYSQSEFAKVLGVSVDTFRKWEQGRTVPDTENALKILRYQEDLKAKEQARSKKKAKQKPE